MPNAPLNPDALASMARIHFESGRTDHRKWEHLYPEIQDTLISEMRPYAEAVLAVAQPAVNSVEELDALPVGSVILDGDPCVLQMVEKSSIVGSEWAVANEEHIYTTGKITLPARVLYRPEVKP